MPPIGTDFAFYKVAEPIGGAMKEKSKADKGAEVMSDPALSRALCSTCNYVQGCTTTRGKAKMMVTQCEEFDDYQPPPPAPQTAAPSTLHKPARNDYRGLCATCAHLSSCTFVKPQGGVWHCEEYQ
jgi:hypothetical protein